MIRKLCVSSLILFNLLLASAIVNAWTHGTVAQSILTSLSVIGTDPTLGSAASRELIDAEATFTGANMGGQFGDAIAMNIQNTSFASPGGANAQIQPMGGSTSTNNNKTTWAPIAVQSTFHSWGQKFGFIDKVDSYAMGDASPYSMNINFAGGPIAGDEGSASVFQTSQQQRDLVVGTITAPPTKSACSTTTTGAIPAPTVTTSIPTFTVTVASTTGCSVNDWIVIEDTLPYINYPQNEAVQITAVNPGVSITAAFKLQHASGVTVKGALVIPTNIAAEFGQGRVLVNLSGSSYSTGTVTSVGGANGRVVTGSGTTWDPGGTKVGPVGGDTKNVGCISLKIDDYSGTPFSAGSPLKSWYQIIDITDNTHLDLFSSSVVGDSAYHHNGSQGSTGPSPYIIRPCVEALQYVGNNLIAEYTNTTWTNGDTIELAISPYPDVSQLQYSLAKWTPGGIYRGQAYYTNSGATLGGFGVAIDALHMPAAGSITAGGTGYTATGTYNSINLINGSCVTPPTANVTVGGGAVTAVSIVVPGIGCISGDVLSVNNADVGGAGSGFQWTFNGSNAPVGFGNALQVSGGQNGILITDATDNAMLLPCGKVCGGAENGTRIAWNSRSISIAPNFANSGLDINSANGTLSTVFPSVVGSGTLPELSWNGFGRIPPVAQAALPTCAAGTDGSWATINNGNSTTYGAAISPAGTSHVLIYCDGTSWKVH